MSKVLICTASTVESKACEQGLSRCAGRDRFEILRTGIGLEAAHFALMKRLRRGPRPVAIVSTGFAGTLDREIPLGSWAWSTSVSRPGQDLIRTPPPPSGLFQLDLPWVEARYSSWPALVQTKSDAGATGAVDMESYSWARLAREHEIPFHIIRLISDTPEQPLPSAIQKWTLCALETSFTRRLKLATQGAAQAGRAPMEWGRFLVRTTRLLKSLSSGWNAFGRHWPPP